MISELCGWVATALFAFSYVPQIYKTYKTKKVEDVSVWLWLALVAAYLLGITYTLSIKAWPILVGNSLGFILVLTYLTLYFKYRRNSNV